MPEFDFSSTSSFKSDDTLSLSSFQSDLESIRGGGGKRDVSSSWKTASYVLMFITLVLVIIIVIIGMKLKKIQGEED